MEEKERVLEAAEESRAPLLPPDGSSEGTAAGGRESTVRSSAVDSESIVSLNLEDQKDYYYYYTESPQMDEAAMKWLRQQKSEVRISIEVSSG